MNGCEYSKDWKTLLKGCNRETYTVREGTINIAEKAFKGFDKLVSIFIPPSLKTIEAEAFRGCKALKTICNYGYETSNNLGSVKRIGYRAFAECSNLNKISLNQTTQILTNTTIPAVNSQVIPTNILEDTLIIKREEKSCL